MSIVDEIRRLEGLARQLTPGRAQRRRLAEPVLAHADAFIDGLEGGRAYVRDERAPRPGLEAEFGEDPTPVESLLATMRDEVETHGINPASGGHLGYIPGGGLYGSALGDFLAAVDNQFAGVEFASPGGVRMEKALLAWMARLAGYPENAAGDLASGGSVANLTAIVTARQAHDLRAVDFHRVAVYLTAQAHHCIDKALRIAGLGEAVLRRVPMDARFRMDSQALEQAIEADLAQGLRPWLIVASAGTTDTGAIDPLPEIAALARQHELWLHVDAAYGGFFVLTQTGAQRLRGMGESDSLVMDPHKGLFLPYGTGALLVRDAQSMRAAHRYYADYMQDAVEDAQEASPADLSPELSRHFRGPRLWLPLKLAGLGPFRAALDEKLLLAQHFHERISATPGFVSGPEPELSVVTYRYEPDAGDADGFNRRLVEALREDGRVFLSSTTLAGRYTLRAAILHVRAHLDEVELALELLDYHARRIAAS